MVASLYRLCLLRLAPLVERLGASLDWGRLDPSYKGLLDDLASPVVEDFLLHLLASRVREKQSLQWHDEWRVCLTPKTRSSPAALDASLFRFIARRCPCMRRLWVLGCERFDPEMLAALPHWVLTVDLDGQLFFRGKVGPALQGWNHPGDSPPLWLVEAEELFKALAAEHQKVPEFSAQLRSQQLQVVELHLGEAQATAAQLQVALKQLPQLRLLRHYQLGTALYQLHAEAWRGGKQLPSYRLRNLDVDFSHVVRCRMSPERVLAPDALQLACLLCPSATQVRIRFDPHTPHDVLAPVATLAKLRVLSAVCVSSGQRAHLDFSDVASVLETHGESLVTLELKVIEEVDVHAVVAMCPRLEELVLSGCGNVTPATCASWGCHRAQPDPPLGPLRKLRLLFFADGDDFSWDHDVPQCFWRWTLLPAPRHTSHLEGIFLESPRLAQETLDHVFGTQRQRKGPMFPFLKVVSLCRAPEFRPQLVAALCAGAPALRYVRASQCESLGPVAARSVREGLRAQDNRAAVAFH